MEGTNAVPTGVGVRNRRSYDDGVLDTTANGRDRGALDVLTSRELEVLQMIASGLTNAEAAKRLHVSVHAIKFHLAVIYKRLGVANRTEAAVTYLQNMNGGLEPRAGG
jgi:DNA-binding NarL/FixJ family response regulator